MSLFNEPRDVNQHLADLDASIGGDRYAHRVSQVANWRTEGCIGEAQAEATPTAPKAKAFGWIAAAFRSFGARRSVE